MQAIHIAALCGHSTVVNALVNTYQVPPNVPVSICVYCLLDVELIYFAFHRMNEEIPLYTMQLKVVVLRSSMT